MPIGVMMIDRENDWCIDDINPTLHHLRGNCGKASDALAAAQTDHHTLENLPDSGKRIRMIFNDRVFALTICGIHAPAGGQIGAMVAWEDVVTQVASLQAQDRRCLQTRMRLRPC